MRLREDFPQISFEIGEVCYWSPSDNMIYYNADDDITLLHELGHALCGHTDFNQDIELLHMERDAWEKAREIGKEYDIDISDERIEMAIDTYREWLHQRSMCPNCTQNGIQDRKKSLYYCLNCSTKWAPNDSRQHQLRRRIKNTP